MAKKKKTDDSKVFMTPASLEFVAKEIWGDKWRDDFQSTLGISYSQLHRYMTIYGGQRIPKIVALSLIMLREFKEREIPSPTLAGFEVDASEAVPVKFVQEKKVRPAKIDRDAPDIDLFGDAPEPEKQPEQAVEAPETPAAPEPAAAPAPDPEPVKARTVRRKIETGPEPEKGRKAKPSLAKASAKLGKALTPKAPAKKAPAKKAKA